MANKYKCGRCEGTGTVVVDLDEDRYPASGPCPQCQQWCPICKDFKPRTGHLCKKL